MNHNVWTRSGASSGEREREKEVKCKTGIPTLWRRLSGVGLLDKKLNLNVFDTFLTVRRH